MKPLIRLTPFAGDVVVRLPAYRAERMTQVMRCKRVVHVWTDHHWAGAKV